jgi:hypothetical protein
MMQQGTAEGKAVSGVVLQGLAGRKLEFGAYLNTNQIAFDRKRAGPVSAFI